MNTMPIAINKPAVQTTPKKSTEADGQQSKKFVSALNNAKEQPASTKPDSPKPKDESDLVNKSQDQAVVKNQDQVPTNQPDPLSAANGNAGAFSAQIITINPICGYVLNNPQAANQEGKPVVVAQQLTMPSISTMTPDNFAGVELNAVMDKMNSASVIDELTTADKSMTTQDTSGTVQKNQVQPFAIAAKQQGDLSASTKENALPHIEITDLQLLNKSANLAVVQADTTTEPTVVTSASLSVVTEAMPMSGKNAVTTTPDSTVKSENKGHSALAVTVNSEMASETLGNDQQNNANLKFSEQSTEKLEPAVPKTAPQVNAFANRLEQASARVESAGPQPLAQSANIQDQFDVTAQIIQKMQILNKPQSSEMIIKLKPEHLGQLTLKVAVDNGVVSASFHSDNAQVRGIIESSLNQLKQEMTNNGIKVDNVGVYTGLNSFMANDQRQTNHQQIIKPKHRVKVNEEFIAELEGVVQNPTVSDSGVDYRV